MIDSKLKDTIIEMITTITELKNTITNTFYNRRKSSIVEYSDQLILVNDLLDKLNILFGGTTLDYINIKKEYNYEWSRINFNSGYLSRFIYDYKPSISYHQHYHITSKLIELCLTRMNIVKETLVCDAFEAYCIVQENNIDKIKESLSTFNHKITSIKEKLDTLFEDKLSIRYF